MDVIKNVRRNNLKTAIPFTLISVIPNGTLIMLISSLITEGFEFAIIFVIAILCFITIPIDVALYRVWKVAINPYSSDLFKKYGSPEKLNKIIKEIENTIEYEDNLLRISKDYISDIKDYEKIVACDDVLGIHKLVHKTNGVVDYYEIILTDKYGQETKYTYKVKDEELVNDLLLTIAKKCKNAELGYTSKEREHIEKNKVDLPESEMKEEYICPDCKKKIEYGDKFCKECGCEIIWDEE